MTLQRLIVGWNRRIDPFTTASDIRRPGTAIAVGLVRARLLLAARGDYVEP
jgi:hypothetical protein